MQYCILQIFCLICRVPADVQHSLDFLDDVISEFTSNTRELDLKQDIGEYANKDIGKDWVVD